MLNRNKEVVQSELDQARTQASLASKRVEELELEYAKTLALGWAVIHYSGHLPVMIRPIGSDQFSRHSFPTACFSPATKKISLRYGGNVLYADLETWSIFDIYCGKHKQPTRAYHFHDPEKCAEELSVPIPLGRTEVKPELWIGYFVNYDEALGYAKSKLSCDYVTIQGPNGDLNLLKPLYFLSPRGF